MQRQIEVRATIQKSDGRKYYPVVLECVAEQSYPFSCSVAKIVLAAHDNTHRQHLSQIRNDDIVFIDVNEKILPAGLPGWEHIFSGRIMDITSYPSALVLDCRGHEEECVYRAITGNYTKSSTTTGVIVDEIVSSYLTRITDASPSLIETGSAVTSYNVDLDTKYVIDVIQELEKLESYEYRFSVVPHKDSSGNLDYVFARWQALPTEATPILKIVEGTYRYIGAYFKTSISQLVNDITIYGESGTPQKVGNATDSTSQTNYNIRHHIDTDVTLATDALCAALAGAIGNLYSNPLISGVAVVRLCPSIQCGDMVYCKLPSIYVNGVSVLGEYRVMGISHNTSDDTTTLMLGDTSISDMWQIATATKQKNRLLSAQFIQ